MAEGRLLPVNAQDLSFSVTGQVAEVLAKEGDQVSARQSLVRLNGREEILARIAAAEYTLADTQKAMDTLKKNAATQLATAQQTLADAQKALKDAQDERYRKNLARVGQTTIDQRQSDLIIAKDVLKKAKENYADYENKPEDNLLKCGPDPVEMKVATTRIANAESQLAAAQKALSGLELRAPFNKP